tara:strand:- start:71 stop:508 length:438 start_codon:yes stop_codon:yes gene_type:complete
MSNHNKIRPVDKDKLNGEYKILFSRPQTKNTNIPKEYIGLQIYNNKFKAEEALLNRKNLTKILKQKRVKSMQRNKRALGNSGGDQTNLTQYNPEVKQLKNAKIKRAKELYKKGFQKSEILRIVIKDFKLKRNINSRSWPKWLCEL